MIQAHPLLRRTWDYIIGKQLIERGAPVLVAVSGGPDSVALLHILVNLKPVLGITEIHVVHFDHQLRGESSTQDRRFVEQLAQSFALPIHVGSRDVDSFRHQHGISKEMAARICRHQYFRRVLERGIATRIALGHTASDQAEELLLRLFRGTGPSGMRGMLPKTDRGIIRPLLFATRPEIIDYLESEGLPYRLDSTNLDLNHQRNVVRHEIIPLIEKYFHSSIVEVLSRHAGLVQDEEECWEGFFEKNWPNMVIEENLSGLVFDLRKLRKLGSGLLRRLLRYAIRKIRGDCFGIFSSHIEALCRLISSGTSGRSFNLPFGISAGIDGNHFLLQKDMEIGGKEHWNSFSFTIEKPGSYKFSSFDLSITLQKLPTTNIPPLAISSPDRVCLDADKILWPLIVRHWRRGDRFHPLGLSGTKKLQDFFVDAKIPRRQRKEVSLLCDSEKICWVVGYRLDDRVKITPGTRQILVAERRLHSGI